MKGLENAPCFNCKKRTQTCHGHGQCKDYEEFREEKRKENKERAKEFSKMIYTGRTR